MELCDKTREKSLKNTVGEGGRKEIARRNVVARGREKWKEWREGEEEEGGGVNAERKGDRRKGKSFPGERV